MALQSLPLTTRRLHAEVTFMLISDAIQIQREARGRGAMGRAPDCLASHACVHGSKLTDPVPGFQKNIIFPPFSM